MARGALPGGLGACTKKLTMAASARECVAGACTGAGAGAGACGASPGLGVPVNESASGLCSATLRSTNKPTTSIGCIKWQFCPLKSKRNCNLCGAQLVIHVESSMSSQACRRVTRQCFVIRWGFLSPCHSCVLVSLLNVLAYFPVESPARLGEPQRGSKWRPVGSNSRDNVLVITRTQW